MKNQICYSTLIFLLFSTILAFGQTRNIADFNAIEASRSVNVTLVKANSPSVEYTMKKGSAEDLITEVKNGTLYVKTKSSFGNWSNSTEADVTVYYKEIDKITATSGCTMKSTNTLVSKTMEIEISSGSTATLDVDTRSIEVDVSSGSTLKLKGQANKGNFEVSSGSTLNAYDFETEIANVEASSGSSLYIHVNDTLDAEASSGSSINYTGNAKNTNIDAGISSSIKRKN